MAESAVLFVGFEPDFETDENNLECFMSPSLTDTMTLPGDIILVYNAGDISLIV